MTTVRKCQGKQGLLRGAGTRAEAGLGELERKLKFRTTEGAGTWSGRQKGTCCEVSVTLWWNFKLHGSEEDRALEQHSVATVMVTVRSAASRCKPRLSWN